MNYQEYRIRGKQMVDYIARYLESIRSRRVLPDVKPGYMRSMLPDSAPYDGESFSSIMMDIERVIMPGVTHWQSPHMHAYFPALNSPASLLGEMLSDGIGCIGFTWASCPASTELEIIVMDWLCKMIGLPDEFLHLTPGSRGGGVIQTSASVATFVCLLAARTEAITKAKAVFENLEDAEINSRLVAYTSDQAHSSVEKAGLIGLVKMRYIESDNQLSLRGDKLKEAIAHDKEKGLIPFYLCATLGTTGACAFDNLEELGPICKSESMWIHVDAAYAGTAFVCSEYRKWLKGIEYADSFAFNPSKWMMVNFDCTAMWVKNSGSLHRTFNVEPLYLKHENSGLAVDFMHWQIPLSKRFRALKLWFVIRNYGIKGLQEHIRKGVSLAQEFESLVLADRRFEIAAPRHLGLVVFRICGENELTEALLRKINTSGQLHCVPASLKGKYVIRFTITSPYTESADIHRDWSIIKETATAVLKPYNYGLGSPSSSRPLPLSEIRKRNPDFGTSLLLSNSPMTPKVMNGSFVAIFEARDAVQEFMRRYGKTLSMVAKDSPVVQRRLRGLLVSDRQFSLDSQMDVMSTLVASTVPFEEKRNKNGHVEEESSGTVGIKYLHGNKETQMETPILEEKEVSPESSDSCSSLGVERVCKLCGQVIRND